MTTHITENNTYTILHNGTEVIEVMMARIFKILDLIDQKFSSMDNSSIRVYDYDEENFRSAYRNLLSFYNRLKDYEENSPNTKLNSYVPKTPVYVSIDESDLASLEKKSEKSGISSDILKEVFLREYTENDDAKAAFDRVNSFIAGGRARSVDDADLWVRHELNEAVKVVFEECDCEKEDGADDTVETEETSKKKKPVNEKLRLTIREALKKNFMKKKDGDNEDDDESDDDKGDGKKAPPFMKKDGEKKDNEGSEDDDEEESDPSGKKDKVVVDPDKKESEGN